MTTAGGKQVDVVVERDPGFDLLQYVPNPVPPPRDPSVRDVLAQLDRIETQVGALNEQVGALNARMDADEVARG